MEAEDLAAFCAVIAKLRAAPALVHHPELGPFREFLLSWPGVRLPANPSLPAVNIDLSDGEADDVPVMSFHKKAAEAPSPGVKKGRATQVGLVSDSEDEDPERVPAESEPPPPMPSCGNLEPSEAEMDACNAAKQRASEALDAGDIQGALARITEAVLSGGASALLFARRAELLLQLRRPNSAILDCAAALEVNPDCGKAFRIRGIAHRRLGHWEAASKDFAQGQKLDYDDDTVAVQKYVDDKIKQLETKKRPALAARLASKRAKVR